MDWSAELWVACHDDDEQNARLARHLWEDNGLDVPETFLDDLLPFLGLRLTVESGISFTDMSYTDHDHAYVRSSVAAAIAEAVKLLPQTTETTISTLCEYYREKVC